MPRVLAVDLGGTKTHVIAADEDGTIRGFADDLDRDWTELRAQVDRRIFKMIRIRHTAEKAAAEAGWSIADFDRVSASCSGADWDFEYPIGVRQLKETLGIECVSYYNDCVGALRGGAEMVGHDCAVICLGTGANCAVYNAEGQDYQYAYYLKDEHQGGGAIGRFIVEAVVDASAGLAKDTALTELLLKKTGFETVEEFYKLCTTGRYEDEKPVKPSYKDFAPLLFEAIRMGDETAREYIDRFCRALARYVIVAADKLGMRERTVRVVISGGVCKGDSIISELVEKYLKERLPGAYCVDARFEPVVGALLLEYDKLYPKGVPAQVMERLEECCRERGLFRPVKTRD